MGKLHHFFGDREFWRTTLRLAVPIALQNLLSSSFHLVDTLMIGQLGSVSVAAVGMAGQVAFVMSVVMFGVGSGGSVFISQYWGAQDLHGVRRSYGVVLSHALGAGLLFTLFAAVFPKVAVGLFTHDPLVIEEGARYLSIAAFSYVGIGLQQAFVTLLRSTEQVKLPLYASLCSVAANAVLNYIFIFGKLGFPAMGVQGAALATVIAAWLNPLVVFVLSLRGRGLLVAPPRELFSFGKKFLLEFYRVALPVVANEGLWALGTMGYNMVFGRLGTENYAALTIFRTLEGIGFAFVVGLCHACIVIVGKTVGAGELHRTLVDAKRFMFLVPAFSLFIGLLFITLRGVLILPFDISAEARATAEWILLLYGCWLPIRNVPYVAIVGVFRAGGDTRTGMVLDLITVWGVALPLVALTGLVFHWPFLAVYVVMLLGEDVIKAVYCLVHFKRLKWLRPVTPEGKAALRALRAEK